MSARRIAPALALVVISTLLATGLAGCNLLQVPHEKGTHITALSDPPAALVLIVDAASARARADARNLAESTARPGERLIVLSAASGALLGTFTAPASGAMTGPALPAPLPGDPTSFQKATYQKNLRRVRSVLRRDQNLVWATQRRVLRVWAGGSVEAALAAARRKSEGSTRSVGLARAITDAVADLSSLQQNGLAFGLRKVVAIIGLADRDANPPRPRASLGGVTVALADGPGELEAPAWQSELLGAGASRVFALTAATRGRLTGIIAGGLEGKDGIALPLTRIRYATDQYRLPTAALPALMSLRRLLAVSYPGATATINGYTDSLKVRGGNVALSWRRAHAVLAWLTAHGIAAARLQAIGHGSASPVARNRAAGQPLNRRVVIIITPAS